MTYPLQNLSPPEFTELIADLLSAEQGARMSKSPEGPDGGIDILRAGSGDQPDVVVQCKHYLASSYSTFRRDLRDEKRKVERLNPKRYIVVTSRQLTVKQKAEVQGMFPQHLHSVDDVMGQQDIEALLRLYPNIERSHYKLWLGSAALLSRVVHQGTSVWYQQLLARLEEQKQVYVQTPSFAKALDILNKHRIVLIAGGPGIGKTTLANMLCANLVAEGFEFREIIDLEHDIKDLPEEGDVVIYYDDFLGHSVWRDTTAGSEKRLESLIRLAERNPRFWLILTTRTYLLEDAKKVSTAVEQRLNKNHEVVLHVDELTLSTRAKIVYNHLFFNRVPASACKSLTDWKRLSKILGHPNFNPRLIEYVAKSGTTVSPPSRYVDFIEDQLKQPRPLYEAAIRDRIGCESRDLLFVLHVLGEPAELEHLYRKWRALRRELDGVSENKEVFLRKSKALDANLVKLKSLDTWKAEKPRDGMSFYNPGVGETVRDLLWLFDDRWVWLCKAARSCWELLNLARCHPDAKPAMPSAPFEATLPKDWYGRWLDLASERNCSHDELIEALGETLELRVWDGQIRELQLTLEEWHTNCSSADWQWSRLGSGHISIKMQDGLSAIPWLPQRLKERVSDFINEQSYDWDTEEASELYDALSNLGDVSSDARARLQEAGLEALQSFLRHSEYDDEISEDSYYQATGLNEGLHLGFDQELDILQGRVKYSPSHSTQVSAPKIADDPLSEAEVRAMFLSLCAGEVSEEELEEELPF